MPELPENEAQRLLLERECLHRTIAAVELGDEVSYIELPGDNERQRLVGRQFTEARRHGKNIFAGSKTGPWMDAVSTTYPKTRWRNCTQRCVRY